jgi:hypothetical protein
MIAVSGFEPNRYVPPWSNGPAVTFLDDCTAVSDYWVINVPAPPPETKRMWDLRAWQARYEAVGRSRELARGELPEPVMRQPARVAMPPRRVHELRCMTRKNRISLLEMVKR